MVGIDDDTIKGEELPQIDLSHLLDSGFAKDGTLVHLASGITFPYHTFVLEWIKKYFARWGKLYESNDQLLQDLTLLQISASDMRTFLSIFYGNAQPSIESICSEYATLDSRIGNFIFTAYDFLLKRLFITRAVFAELVKDKDAIETIEAQIFDAILVSFTYASRAHRGPDPWKDKLNVPHNDMSPTHVADRMIELMNWLVCIDPKLEQLFSQSMIIIFWTSFRDDKTPHTVLQYEYMIQRIVQAHESDQLSALRIFATLSAPHNSLNDSTAYSLSVRDKLNSATLIELSSIKTTIRDALSYYASTHIFGIKHAFMRSTKTKNALQFHLPRPNFDISIAGSDVSYKVHDFVLVEWSYFKAIVKAGLGECTSRTICLPSNFSQRALQLILGILYGVNLERSADIGQAIHDISSDDLNFVLQNALEYGLVSAKDNLELVDLPSYMKRAYQEIQNPIQCVQGERTVRFFDDVMQVPPLVSLAECSENSPRVAKQFEALCNKLYNLSNHRDQLSARFGQVQFLSDLRDAKTSQLLSEMIQSIVTISVAKSTQHAEENVERGAYYTRPQMPDIIRHQYAPAAHQMRHSYYSDQVYNQSIYERSKRPRSAENSDYDDSASDPEEESSGGSNDDDQSEQDYSTQFEAAKDEIVYIRDRRELASSSSAPVPQVDIPRTTLKKKARVHFSADSEEENE